MGFDQAAADPQQVSEAVFQAITAEAPQPRYLVGESARQMVGMLSLTDETRDETLLQMWEKVT